MNQHYDAAQALLALTAVPGDSLEGVIVMQEAQVQATLALAHEQRTANLLEWWRLGNIDGASVEQLRERLGMEENQ